MIILVMSTKLELKESLQTRGRSEDLIGELVCCASAHFHWLGLGN